MNTTATVIENTTDTQHNETVHVSFAAIDPVLIDNIVRPIEKDVRGKEFVTWGEYNDFPDYIDNLYHNCATLKSIIDGFVDYICGNAVQINVPGFTTTINADDEEAEELIRDCSFDWAKFGGCAINVIRNINGGIAGLKYISLKNLRSNKKNAMFYYSEDWGSKTCGRAKFIEIPAFNKDAAPGTNLSSILYLKNNKNSVYPFPIYGASLAAAEMQLKINDFQLNSLYNGFTSNYIINFNNGTPNQTQQKEIEGEFYEKFTGPENSGRPMMSFNKDSEHATTVTSVPTDNFADKYAALKERSEQELFTAFRATPNLFGIVTKTTGFSEQEYAEAFKLFNRTMVHPVQQRLRRAIDKIFGLNDTLTIVPFSQLDE